MSRCRSCATMARSSASPPAAGSTPTMSSNISRPAASSSTCCEGWRPERGPDRCRGRRLGGRHADPACLPTAVGGAAHGPVADLSGHERGRRGRFRDQRLVAWGDPIGRVERAMAADRSDRIMADHQETRIVDLSHVIEHGMTTYPGLPPPHICDFWTRDASAANYDDGSSFHIGRIDMVANTGTYVDSPFHRYADGIDLAELPLSSLADLPAVMVRRPWEKELATTAADLEGLDVRGKAVLVHTGWDRQWRTGRYGVDHAVLT